MPAAEITLHNSIGRRGGKCAQCSFSQRLSTQRFPVLRTLKSNAATSISINAERRTCCAAGTGERGTAQWFPRVAGKRSSIRACSMLREEVMAAEVRGQHVWSLVRGTRGKERHRRFAQSISSSLRKGRSCVLDTRATRAVAATSEHARSHAMERWHRKPPLLFFL